jgi:hypothetical protein
MKSLPILGCAIAFSLHCYSQGAAVFPQSHQDLSDINSQWNNQNQRDQEIARANEQRAYERTKSYIDFISQNGISYILPPIIAEIKRYRNYTSFVNNGGIEYMRSKIDEAIKSSTPNN